MNVRESMPSESDVFAESLSSSKPLARDVYLFLRKDDAFTRICVCLCVSMCLCACACVSQH